MSRNVVTLSHLDPGLHQWLKEEARRRTEATGARVHIYELIGEAVDRYKSDSCRQSYRTKAIPTAAQV
ncbi:hypothetical protein LCGC14_2753030 [marine sediment metagenome]|uniref:Uncharacterized protein n=1 Tax=marine sediment metagenome TaxID=412755 RepID=A0A0F9BSX6_9ZZZZ